MLEHDGQPIGELTVEVKINIVDVSYRVAAGLITAVTPEVRDPQPTAVLVLGALVAIRRTVWTFGAPPLDIDDARGLIAWADRTLAILEPAHDSDRA